LARKRSCFNTFPKTSSQCGQGEKNAEKTFRLEVEKTNTRTYGAARGTRLSRPGIILKSNSERLTCNTRKKKKLIQGNLEFSCIADKAKNDAEKKPCSAISVIARFGTICIFFLSFGLPLFYKRRIISKRVGKAKNKNDKMFLYRKSEKKQKPICSAISKVELD